MEEEKQDATFSEIAEDVEKEDTGLEETSSDSEEPQEEPVSEEDAQLKELDSDEEFKAATEEFQKEMGNKLSFAQTKSWRKNYFKRKEAERLLKETQGKELTDEELYQKAQERGLLAQQKQEASPTQPDGQQTKVEEEFNQDKFQKMYMDADPAQRQWMDFMRNVAKMESAENRQKLQAYEQKFGNIEQKETMDRLSKVEVEAKEYVKQFNQDWDSQILPELRTLAGELQRSIKPGLTLADAGWDAMKLTKQVLANKGFEIGKAQALKEQKEKQETLKKANMETGTNEPAAEIANNDDFSDILEEEKKRAGMSSFM